jgi:M6 family metalloprotease-like protein
MQHKGRLAIAIAVLLTLAGPVQAATPKAGAKCTKAGTTATASGKKFTCIKSGTKLVWNKGVAIKAAPKPIDAPTPDTSKPEEKVGTKILLAADPRISPISALTNLDTCKTEDKTPYFQADGTIAQGNGFPRPNYTVSGKKSARVLIVPMAFKNLPFTDDKNQAGSGSVSDLDQLNKVIPAVKESFKSLSRNKFEITIDVLPKSQWWVFNTDSPFSTMWGVPHSPALQKILDEQKQDFSFKGYDTVAFATGNGLLGPNNISSAQAGFLSSKNTDTGNASVVFMIGALDRSIIWVHEFGHSLFGLEDLYPFSDAAAGRRSDRTSGAARWDLMADSSETNLLEWNKFLMGWLDDNEVRCIAEQTSTVHYLTHDASSKNPKLLTVNLSPGVTIAAEAKPRSASTVIDGSRLLLYTINSYIESGAEPVVALSTLYSKGESKSLLGWTFNVLDSDDNGLLVEAIKTDIDKFVVPAPQPRPTQSTPISSKIKIEKSEIVSAGQLKARITWNVTGHESYRVFVVAADDAQKVFFETGIRNGSQNPLVVEISGLSCNREMRVTTMFFSEKDGKGERLVRDNRDLGILSCVDTTKKP